MQGALQVARAPRRKLELLLRCRAAGRLSRRLGCAAAGPCRRGRRRCAAGGPLLRAAGCSGARCREPLLGRCGRCPAAALGRGACVVVRRNVQQQQPPATGLQLDRVVLSGAAVCHPARVLAPLQGSPGVAGQHTAHAATSRSADAGHKAVQCQPRYQPPGPGGCAAPRAPKDTRRWRQRRTRPTARSRCRCEGRWRPPRRRRAAAASRAAPGMRRLRREGVGYVRRRALARLSAVRFGRH